MLITIKEKIEVDENYLMRKLNPDPFVGLDICRILLFNKLGNDFQISIGFSVDEIDDHLFTATMTMETDEMEPTIKKGDTVTIDTFDREYEEGGIYALFTKNASYISFDVRRLFYDKDSHIAILKKDNIKELEENYEALRCDDLNEIILGRIRLA